MRRISIWLIIAVITLIALLATAYNISNSRSFQFFGGIVDRVQTQQKVVALTFDDGPTEKTDEILKLLEFLDVKATFFVSGWELEQNIEEGRRIVSAGHEIGNHSYSHKRMVLKSPGFIKEDIEKTDQLIRQVGYEGEIHFRPPNAKKLLILPYMLRQFDTKTIMWDVEPDSYPQIASSSDKIVDHVVENVEPGSIILLHVMYESRRESLNSVEGIVEALRRDGYTFKTVSELLEYHEVN
ncbi:polysaccharide deacetylase family protein [Dethiobacter alkaliphilus]|uniref:polysaccharide deacetylase family protein n=1 Tax=Dethiobacter alkaliphilus TaxID=427926 RepID=UPI0022280404|nr:polysaccharide deacetylase family protein [Dethiobacter alkaliphilus]MCW3489761.1 polysaccharide deacetylase family protein [Dethiobacter alkaliphilus]